MEIERFEQLVRAALAALPESIRGALDNLAFIVEKKARRKKAGELGVRVDEVLLGLYEGIPKIERGAGYFGVLPDKITIFQGPIEEMAAGDEIALRDLVQDVVWHEVGHHLGFGEKKIRSLEKKWNRRRRVSCG
jgi:predicted Zn-dependent protease with MMP-like domain